MYFSLTFFASAAFVLPTFATPHYLVDVVKYAGKTNGGYIVMFKSNEATCSFANKNMVTYCYKIINGCAGKFTDKDIQELQANPDVKGIYEDGLGVANAAPKTTVQTDATWGLTRLSSKEKLKYTDILAANFTFYYQTTAGQASDIYTQADFGGHARWGKTFGGHPDIDDNGHGTWCAGIAAGTRYGVAKKANVIAVKVLNATGHGPASDVIAGLDYVLQSTQASGHPSVVSLSLAYNITQPLDDAVARACFFCSSIPSRAKFDYNNFS
ncbi:hypothetical protein C0995_014095 [Termitomyces sp. Mi166|nr:hypothetical protein C0995_014095 [Termitomyces sp. Mi166\